MQTKSTTPIQDYITLESISEKKADIRGQLEESRKAIQRQTKGIFAPASPKGGNNFMNHISSGIAIFDGVMTGIRIMRKIRSVLYYRKRY